MTPPRNKAFTIIELITVIAIGAVLMSMVLPLAQGARRQYLIADTKARFHRYTLAIEQFRAEYGAYPTLDGNPLTVASSPIDVNAFAECFVELMTGNAVGGGAMSNTTAEGQNTKALSFLHFNNNELTAEGKLQDSFGQTNIQLFYDTDGNGFLDGLSNVRGSVGWRSNGNGNGGGEIITSWQ